MLYISYSMVLYTYSTNGLPVLYQSHNLFVQRLFVLCPLFGGSFIGGSTVVGGNI